MNIVCLNETEGKRNVFKHLFIPAFPVMCDEHTVLVNAVYLKPSYQLSYLIYS